MTTIVLTRSHIRGRFIEKFYVCPHCIGLFQIKRKAFEATPCPYCKALRCTFRVKWKLKPKYRSPEQVAKLKKAFYIGQKGFLHRGALESLVEAIQDHERDSL